MGSTVPKEQPDENLTCAILHPSSQLSQDYTPGPVPEMTGGWSWDCLRHSPTVREQSNRRSGCHSLSLLQTLFRGRNRHDMQAVCV